MDFLDIVSKFQLEKLNRQWVERVHRDDFTNEKTLPDEYELLFLDDSSESLYTLMKNLCDSIKEWLREDLNSSNLSQDSSTSVRKSWQALIKHQFDYKGLIAVLSTFIKIDLKELVDEEARLCALTAADLYFILISIHGSQIFSVFNSILFGQAVEQFRIVSLIQSSGTAKPSHKKSKRKEAEEETDCNTQDSTEQEVISSDEINKIFKILALTIEDLEDSLNNLQLKNNREILVQIVHVLVFLIKSDKTTLAFPKTLPKQTNITYLAYKSYEILNSFCNPRHGDLMEIVRYLMKSLLSELIWKDQDLQMSFKYKNYIREHILCFIKQILHNVGKPAYGGVKGLLQQLCIKTNEKADLRAKSLQQIVDILIFLPDDLFNDCCLWILSLSHAYEVKNRVVAVELISKLLLLDERETRSEEYNRDNESVDNSSRNGDVSEDENNINTVLNHTKTLNHKFLLTAIISRFDDISATVRAKCLSIFASLLTSNSAIKRITVDLFVQNKVDDNRTIFDFKKFFCNADEINVPEDPLPKGSLIMEKVELLSADPKVFVRKSALQILINICRLDSDWITAKRIDIFVKACKDNSVIIRKLMVQGITELLLTATEREDLQKAWVTSVFPLIADNEVKSQEKVIETVGNVILDNMKPHSHTVQSKEILPWKLISLVSSLGLRRLFRFVCRQWAILKYISADVIRILQSHIGTENNLSAWFLLVCISEFETLKNPNFILEYFFENVYNNTSFDEYCSQLVMEAVHLNWKECKIDLIENLCTKLKLSIENFQVPFTLIARYFDICVMYDSTNAKSWAVSLIESCENYLHKVLHSNTEISENLELGVVQRIFTLGEAIQISPGVIKEDTKDMLVTIVDMDPKDGEADKGTKQSSLVTAVTVITLGKLCLQDQLLSKKVVPVFGSLLVKSPTPIKINSLISLADLCVRFTSLVEPYLGEMALCLKDQDWKIRNKTLTLITQLLQEDYIKLKSPIFFFILSMINDSCLTVKKNAAMFLVNTVLKKYPRIMGQEFIKAILFYNSYHESYGFCQFEISPRELDAFCIPGNTNKGLRRNLYKFMMNKMDDELKFKVTCQLCSEILDKVCEGKIPLEQTGIIVLEDALYAIACEGLRISNSRGSKDDDENELTNGTTNNAVKNIMDRIGREVLKKNYMEHCIPIFIRLKRKLTEIKSPLITNLMVALKELIKDYKEEIDEILAGDSELAAEIALDLRNLEENGNELTNADEQPALDNLPMSVKDLKLTCEKLADQIVQSTDVYLDNALHYVNSIETRDSLVVNHVSSLSQPCTNGNVQIEQEQSRESLSTQLHEPVQSRSPSYNDGTHERRISNSPLINENRSKTIEAQKKSCPSLSFNDVMHSTHNDTGVQDKLPPPSPIINKSPQITEVKMENNTTKDNRRKRRRN